MSPDHLCVTWSPLLTPVRCFIAPGFSNFQMVDVCVLTLTRCAGDSVKLFSVKTLLCFWEILLSYLMAASSCVSSVPQDTFRFGMGFRHQLSVSPPVASLTVFWLCFLHFLSSVSQSSDVAVTSHVLISKTSCESWKSPWFEIQLPSLASCLCRDLLMSTSYFPRASPSYVFSLYFFCYKDIWSLSGCMC